MTNKTGLEIVRFLLAGKLAGQRELLPRLGAAAWLVESFDTATALLEQARPINELSWQSETRRSPTGKQTAAWPETTWECSGRAFVWERPHCRLSDG
jgi:hypothetical protein